MLECRGDAGTKDSGNGFLNYSRIEFQAIESIYRSHSYFYNLVNVTPAGNGSTLESMEPGRPSKRGSVTSILY